MLDSNPGSATSTVAPAVGPAGVRGTAWWIEIGAAAVVALAYLLSPRSSPSVQLIETAHRNAEAILGLERSLGIDVEPLLQDVVLRLGLPSALNWSYGSLHFVVTAAVLVHLFCRRPAHYQRWRAAFVISSLLAFGVYRLWPVTPPRLLPAGEGKFMVDTMAEYPALWDFEQGLMSDVANHYAAMPSMHAGWALFCALAFGIGRSTRVRVALLAYPLATTFVIMATGNHFLLDAVAGFAVIGIGLALATAGERALLRRWGNGAGVLSRPVAGGDVGGRDARHGRATGRAGVLRARGPLVDAAGPGRRGP